MIGPIRPSGAVLLSAEGTVLEASDLAAGVLGYVSGPDLVGRDWRQWLDISARPLLDRDILPGLAAKGWWQGSLAFRRADRTILELTAVLQALSGGFLLLALRDPTSLAALEQEQSALREQFHQAMTMQAIGRLSGSVAHEFNNILAASLGYSEMLVEDLPEGSPQRRFAENIHRSSERARILVQQLLTFARPKEAPGGRLDLNAVFADVTRLMHSTMPPQIEFSFQSASGPLVADANFGHMSQVLMHLVGNARDAVGREKGRIGVTLERVAGEALTKRFAPALDSSEDRPWIIHRGKEGQFHQIQIGRPDSIKEYAFLRIDDSGSGMTFDVLTHMFEPFFTTRKFGSGAGLGLSAVHGIVSSLSGLIDIESAPGKGTKFSVFLPLTQNTAPIDAKAGGRGQVLVIAPSEAVCESWTADLNRAGWAASYSTNPDIALELLEEEKGAFVAAIVDGAAEDKAPATLMTRLRRIDPDLPVLLLAAKVPAGMEAGDKRTRRISPPPAPEALVRDLERFLAEFSKAETA